MLYKTLFVQHYYTLFWSGTITAIYWHDGVALLVRRNGIFAPSYAKLSFLDFEELISNAKDEKEKLFFNMLLQYFMENNFNKVLREEKY